MPSNRHKHDDLPNSQWEEEKVLKSLRGWHITSSNNETSTHHSRFTVSFSVLGFGAVVGAVLMAEYNVVLGMFFILFSSILSLILNVIYDRDEKSWRKTVSLFEEIIHSIMVSHYDSIKEEIRKLNGGPKKAFAEFHKKYTIRPLDRFSRVLVTLSAAITILTAAMLAASYLDFTFNIDWKTEATIEPKG